ncbi:hypothetical protein [Rheinheimera tangshanensis]|uniref:Sel1 repeat family protein n=1 Tax=Rheinheimera tangshanensis TaxID=400153 RepID=A0A5C8LNS5_9GAMM|nr:hypothetical protein [Rheinheimera tangshanensis]TXK77915.1 hypothetical protein FU839_17610 [Rheinheimera tangshanensis]GGM44058.1 hypothetical protein GCM10010920_00300 [Rheinheimera tangshanensis]
MKKLLATSLVALLLSLLISGGLFFIASNNSDTQPQTPQISAIQEPNPTPLATESELVTKPNSSPATPEPAEQLVVIEQTDWKLDQPLRTQLTRLKNLADQGDLQAAYSLAMNLRFCNMVPLDETDLEARLQQAYQYKDDGVAIANIKERYQFCAGIDQQQRAEFYAYLETAAKAGYVPAQEEMATITPEQYLKLTDATELARQAYIQKRDEFIQLQLSLLESALQHGSIKALITLSNMHHSQNYGEHGRAKSYAFNLLILELTDDNELQSRYSGFVQRRQSELSPEQIEQAQVLSEQWLAMIKANGSLYLP